MKAIGLFCGFLLGVQVLWAQKITTQTYIDTYKNLAVSEMKKSGIPASITLAQGILESGSGNSSLAVNYHNHFGIKCHDWGGNKTFHNDDKKGECFRHYNTAEESFRDHTDFLMSRSRYAFLFNYKSTDYKSWAKGLRKAGYATAPDYPEKLITVIEKYNLHQYDTGVAVNKSEKNKTDKQVSQNQPKKTVKKTNIDNFSVGIEHYAVKEYNRTEYIQAKAGDSYESLTKTQDMMPWQLPKYNDAELSKPLKEGEIVYIQPKRRRAARGKEYHLLREGETMRDVSQMYAVKLKRLYYLNNLEEGSEPKAGMSLNLRKRKAVRK
ncbi:MAG: glucosaminidase domain-containing protein [Bacteroidales bacterium]|nr:glucosaminidase domain-containing protein [Bacteroidales bacterium]